jgi:Subtilisin-like serine proteases
MGANMKKLLAVVLFFGALFWVLSKYAGLGAEGEFNAIAIELKSTYSPDALEVLEKIKNKYDLEINPNSVFSQNLNLFTLSPNSKCTSNAEPTKEKLPEGTLRWSGCTRLTGYSDEYWQKILAEVRQELGKYAQAIEPNYEYKLDFIGSTRPNDPLYSRQWNLTNINIEKAWEKSKGKGVVVAVIDTGVSRVEDLQKTEFVKGYDFVNDDEDASDDNGHGTHVAGTIAQSTNNNLGVAGIAYEAKIMPLKVLNAFGAGTITDIAEAIRFAADHGANIINMSLGGAGESAILKEAIDYAYNKGVTIIAAAGNANYPAAFYPARYPKVIGVSATSATGEKAFYSNYGAGVDISAPGGDMRGPDGTKNEAGGILQNTIDKRGKSIYASFQGTSMASPHVAGVAALIESLGINKPEEVLHILKQSVVKVSDDPHNFYGAGRIDAAAAVQLASKGKLDFRDFFRWLRDNGYLSPRFWIDGGVMSIPLKLLIVIGSYLLAWLLRNWFPFSWNWSFTNGLFFGGTGLFILRGFYVFDLPQTPFRLMGSSIVELGNVFSNTNALNPITASVLLPFLMLIFLLGHARWKWFAIGSAISVSVALTAHAIFAPEMMWITDIWQARAYLGLNALLCFGLAYLSAKSESGAI